jgi:ABC-type uncharacterized transport system involved in gliding motility auxiliary subunit
MAMKFRKSDIATIAYLVSLVLLLACGAWYIVNRDFDLVIKIGLILVLLGCIAGILLDPDRVRRALKGRQARYGSNALVFSLAFIGILSVLNFLLYENPIRWDLTEDQEYSLAPETLRILDELPEKVTVKAFYSLTLASSKERIRLLLEQYRVKSNGKLDFEFIDPDENPFLAQQYGIVRDGSLVVILGETSEIVEYPTEELLSEALVRVFNPGERTVYFLTGHGERDIEGTDEYGYSQIVRSLGAKNYDVKDLNLIADANIPQNGKVIVIASPESLVSENEIGLLQEYLEGGGALVFLSEPKLSTPETGEEDPLIDYLKTTWGIELNNDIVVDLNSSLPLYGIANKYASHSITDDLKNTTTYFPTAQSLKTTDFSQSSITTTELVLTGENSWGETDLEALGSEGSLEYNEDVDEIGPLTLVVTAENSETGARIVVFGDSDFASNGFFYDLGNGDLIVNSIDWAAGEEQLISLTPKSSTQRYVTSPSVQTIGIIFLVTVVLIPGIFIVFGISTWWQRRKRV